MIQSEQQDYPNSQIDKAFLCLLTVCLGFRDILPNLNVNVVPLLALIYVIPYVIIAREILHRRFSSKMLWLIGGVICFYMAIIPLNLNGFKLFLPLFLGGIAFRNLDLRFIAKSFFLMEIFVVLVRWILISHGILEVNHTYSYKINTSIAYDLGYGNPNTPSITFFVMLCCLYILMFEHWKWLSFVLLFCTSVMVFNYSGGRTSFFCNVLLMLTYFVPGSFLKRYVYNKVLLYSIPIAMIAFLFLTGSLMEDNSEMDTLMSGRVRCMDIIMSMFSSPLVFLTGLQSDAVGDVDFPVDNGMAYLLCLGGVPAVVILLVCYFLLVKNKAWIPTCLLTAIVVFFVSGFGEKTIANFGVSGGSLFWMILFNVQYAASNVEENEEECIEN